MKARRGKSLRRPEMFNVKSISLYFSLFAPSHRAPPPPPTPHPTGHMAIHTTCCPHPLRGASNSLRTLWMSFLPTCPPPPPTHTHFKSCRHAVSCSGYLPHGEPISQGSLGRRQVLEWGGALQWGGGLRGVSLFVSPKIWGSVSPTQHTRTEHVMV